MLDTAEYSPHQDQEVAAVQSNHSRNLAAKVPLPSLTINTTLPVTPTALAPHNNTAPRAPPTTAQAQQEQCPATPTTTPHHKIQFRFASPQQRMNISHAVTGMETSDTGLAATSLEGAVAANKLMHQKVGF